MESDPPGEAKNNILDPLSEAKINILFHEYDNLSRSILSRYAFFYQLIWSYGAVLAGLFVALVANGGKTIPIFAWCVSAQNLVVCGIIFVTAAFAAMQIWIDRDIWKAAGQLQTLESQINHLFGVPLLSWE